MDDRGKSEIDLLREELVELRAELEQLKAEDQAEEQEPKRPNLRLIQGGLFAGAIGGWLWGRRRQAAAALATGAASTAAIVLVPDDYSGPQDLQVPERAPISTPRPESTGDPPEPTQTTTHQPVRPGTQRTQASRAPTRKPSEAFKTPDADPVPSTVEIPTAGVTVPSIAGTVTPTLPIPTVGADALPGPSTVSGSCRATIVTVTICIPTKKP